MPIEHFSVSEAQGVGKYGRFGVVRNNWYKLNIENMISIGAPVLPEPKSEFIEDATRSAVPETKSNSEYSDQKSVNHILNKYKGYDKYFKKDNLF